MASRNWKMANSNRVRRRGGGSGGNDEFPSSPSPSLNASSLAASQKVKVKGEQQLQSPNEARGFFGSRFGGGGGVDVEMESECGLTDILENAFDHNPRPLPPKHLRSAGGPGQHHHQQQQQQQQQRAEHNKGKTQANGGGGGFSSFTNGGTNGMGFGLGGLGLGLSRSFSGSDNDTPQSPPQRHRRVPQRHTQPPKPPRLQETQPLVDVDDDELLKSIHNLGPLHSNNNNHYHNHHDLNGSGPNTSTSTTMSNMAATLTAVPRKLINTSQIWIASASAVLSRNRNTTNNNTHDNTYTSANTMLPISLTSSLASLTHTFHQSMGQFQSDIHTTTSSSSSQRTHVHMRHIMKLLFMCAVVALLLTVVSQSARPEAVGYQPVHDEPGVFASYSGAGGSAVMMERHGELLKRAGMGKTRPWRLKRLVGSGGGGGSGRNGSDGGEESGSTTRLEKHNQAVQIKDTQKRPPMLDVGGRHVGVEIPVEYDGLAEIDTGSLVSTTGGGTGGEVPFFWHVPRAGGITMRDVLTQCFGFTIVGGYGPIPENLRTNEIKVLKSKDGAKFINVDTYTPDGIQRAKSLHLTSSPTPNVIFGRLLAEGSTMFTPDHPGRFFALFRHPIQRAASLFYYTQAKVWKVREPDSDLASMSIDDYFRSGRGENNWMVRFLSNEMSGRISDQHLDVAKEVLRRKCMVGLLEEKGESMVRFERLFGWTLKDTTAMECYEKKLQWSWSSKNRHDPVEEGSELWSLILRKNEFDLELYKYAVDLFREQGKLFGS